MHKHIRLPATLVPLFLAVSVAVVGCSSADAPAPKAGGSGKSATETAEEASASADEPAVSEEEANRAFVLGNMVEKFDPPSLDELAKLKWHASPVLDGMVEMRKLKAQQPKPAMTPEDALKLRNDSPENNEKILAALGELPPADDRGIDFEAKMIRHGGGDLNSTNPLFASSVTDQEFGDLTGLVLITFDRDLKYFAPAELVASWETSDDSLCDKFVLRDDITWSDGQPLTAHDVEFSFQLIMSDHPLLVIPAVRTGVDQLKYIKAYDDRTLVVFHKESLATNAPNMNFPILPKHIYEKSVYEDPSLKRSKYHTEQEAHPVVAGAYEYVSRKRGEEFVVRRRESYFTHGGKQVRPKPYFSEVRVKTIEDLNTALLAVKAGDIYEMEVRAEQWESQTNDDAFYKHNTKVTAPEWTEFHIAWNQKSADGSRPNPYFSDKRVRWAMTYAMDYDELINTICRGLYQQARGTFHPTSWMFPKNPPALVNQDLDKAEDLLDEAGWADSDGDGVRDMEIDGRLVPFEFQLMTSQTEVGIAAATLMKECLERIGITVNVKPTEFVVMQDKLLKHEFDACLGGWGAGTDPDMQSNIYGTGAQRNYGQYSNPKVDELFVEGRRELDPEKRAEIYAQIHMQLWDDQPVSWMFNRNAFYAFNKRLRGYNFGALGPFKYSPGFGSLYTPVATP